MLIFFIVTATFVKEAGVEVFKPQAKTSESMKTANILIAIDSKDGIWIDGAQIEPTAVTVNVKRLRSENPKGTIMIQADKESSHNMLLEVYEGAKEAGADEIAISTETS
jgi:biopolymer transport protein ExbD